MLSRVYACNSLYNGGADAESLEKKAWSAGTPPPLEHALTIRRYAIERIRLANDESKRAILL